MVLSNKEEELHNANTFLRERRAPPGGWFRCSQPLSRAVVNRLVERPPGLNFDAVTELWLPSAEAATALLASPHLTATYLPERLRIADEMRTLPMWTRINYVRPGIGECRQESELAGALLTPPPSVG